jgi:hypothetical protein
MFKQRYFIFAAIVIAVFTISLLGQGKAKDAYGKPDRVDVTIKQIKPNQFTMELGWDNDEKLAAMAFPLTVKGNGFKMRYDSVSWKGRADYFAVKSVRPIDSTQQVLVGFLADINGKTPPMNEGKGTLATLFFTAVPGAKKVAEVCDITTDTTFIPPSNTLSGVIPDGTGSIYPSFSVVKLSPSGQPAACK